MEKIEIYSLTEKSILELSFEKLKDIYKIEII